jgi:phenylpropionate dioxygenase-like ring-hydroxylating dioxygenase large terminal subunit
MDSDNNPAPASAAGEMLRGFWYIAARSSELRRRKPQRAMLLDIPLVIGRDENGRAFAMRDNCPHRGIPLSYGRVCGDTLECCYHGWRFDVHSGQCREIPSLTPDSKLKVERIYAGAFPCEERDGYIWAFISDGRPADVPPAPQLPTFSPRYRMAHLSAELPLSIDHGVIGLMDPAHGPFVHQAWWWRTRHSIHEKQKRFEPIPLGFRMSPHSPSSNSAPYRLLRRRHGELTTTIDFVLPNMRFEQIRAGDLWFSSRAVVTPVRRDHCRIDFCAAWNLFPWLPFTPTLLKLFGRKFIDQDRRTMEQQAEGLRYAPNLMLIDDADRPAKWYFALKQNYLESQRTGAPMKHPLDGPVTLHWRS